jgi:transposase
MISLPSLHTLDRAQVARIWLATEATDMRCGFDRLAERVRGVIGQDPLSGHYFVFRSRRGDRLKILLWERDGFLLWYTRIPLSLLPLRGGSACSAALRRTPTVPAPSLHWSADLLAVRNAISYIVGVRVAAVGFPGGVRRRVSAAADFLPADHFIS